MGRHRLLREARSPKMAGPLDIVWWCDDPTVKPLAVTDAAVGIDVGLGHLLALSTGE